MDGRSHDLEADSRKGADFARRSLQVAGDDPGVFANAALALAFFGEDIGAMMTWSIAHCPLIRASPAVGTLAPV